MFEINDPLTQNILATIGTVIYVKVVIGFCDLCVTRFHILPVDISRKIIHIAAGSWIVWWDVFTDDHWTWMLNVTVPIVYTIQLFVKGSGIIKVDRKNDPDVLTMSRSGNPKELLYGPLQFTVVMTIIGLHYYKERLGIMIMSALGWGDGIAPIIGQRYPFLKYQTLVGNNKKTISGSIAFFISTIIGSIIFSLTMSSLSSNHKNYTINEIIIFSFIATLTEGMLPHDNIFIPLSIILTSTLLQLD